MTEMKVNESRTKVIELIAMLEKRMILMECPQDEGWFD